MLRAAKPKLSLCVPTAAISHAAPKSPCRIPSSPAAITPTARNTLLNQRGLSTLQPPTFAYTNAANAKSILKKGAGAASGGKRIAFTEAPSVKCITPLPEDCYGDYAKMSREERRWKRGD